MKTIILEYVQNNAPSVYTERTDRLDAWNLACILSRFAIKNRDCEIIKIYVE